MAFNDIDIEVDETSYVYSKVYATSRDSKFRLIDTIVNGLENLFVRHTPGKPNKKNPAKTVSTHNILLERKVLDTALAEYDPLKVSLTVTYPDGSPNIDRADLTLAIQKICVAAQTTEVMDRLLRNEV